MQGGLFGLALLGAVAIQGVSGNLDPQRVVSEVSSGPLALPSDAGFLRVVADPWAHVTIDGRHIVTTPSARPIPLVPGEHFVKLENPYFTPIDRRIQIRANQTEWLDVTFEPPNSARPTPGGEP